MSFNNIEEIQKSLGLFKKAIKNFIKNCREIFKELMSSVNKFKKSYSDETILEFTDRIDSFINTANRVQKDSAASTEGAPPAPTQVG